MTVDPASARSDRATKRDATSFEGALKRAQERVLAAFRDERDWRDAIRAGLHELLLFLDEDPAAALELLLPGSFAADSPALVRRREAFDRLIDAVDAGRSAARAPEALSRITAEGVVGGVLAILQDRLATGSDVPLAALAGELMSIVVSPYLGPSAATRERRRPAPRAAPADRLALGPPGLRLTYRTMLVLAALAKHPGSSNRHVGELANIIDPGQISKLLSRLEHYGLVTNNRPAHAQGSPNAWHLTSRGMQLHRSVRERL